jgi:uncharacterized protein (TIRG00374 family)
MTTTPDQNAASATTARHRSWSFWLGLLASLGCLVWALGALDWAAVAAALTRVNPLWVAASVLTVLLTIVTRLARWAVLLYPRRMRWSSLLAAMLVGQLLNYFAPARSGDLARAYLLGYAERESKVWALGTVALEKLWDIWALLTWIALLSFSTALPNWLTLPARGLVLLSLLALVFCWLALLYRFRVVAWIAWLGRYLPPHLSVRLHGSVERLFDGLEGLRRPRVWLWTAIWTAATWGLGTLTNHTALMALGLSLPFSASLMLMVVLQMGVAVPSLPGRVGVFEGLCIVSLALFGVERDAAFAVGLVLHAVVFVPPTLLGLYYTWRVKALAQQRGVAG